MEFFYDRIDTIVEFGILHSTTTHTTNRPATAGPSPGGGVVRSARAKVGCRAGHSSDAPKARAEAPKGLKTNGSLTEKETRTAEAGRKAPKRPGNNTTQRGMGMQGAAVQKQTSDETL